MKPHLVAAGALCAILVLVGTLAATPAQAADPAQGNPLAVPPQVDSSLATPPQVREGATTPPVATPAPTKSLSPNEAAGLPDLDAINRSPTKNGSANANVEFPDQRTPSFHQKERSGTEITEYRDHAKPTEIDVHSNFGTNYRMSPPTDDSPKIPNAGNGPSTGRLPSINITY
jgi:hypothetical protein